MTGVRRAFPWLMSAALHGAILLLPVGMILAPHQPARSPLRVDLAIVGARGIGSGPSRGAGPADAVQGAAPPASAASQASGAETPPALRSVQADTVPLPSSNDVLRDVDSVTTAVSAPHGAAVSPAGQAGAQFGWEGAPRKLIRRRNPEFPPVLSAMGQEIEGEARIVVAPSGIVTRVEITRSSGYIEVDASVQTALRDYLFSRVDGKTDAVGTVRFRYRLEKQD